MLDSLTNTKTTIKSPLHGGLPAGQAGVAQPGFASLKLLKLLKLRESEGGYINLVFIK